MHGFRALPVAHYLAAGADRYACGAPVPAPPAGAIPVLSETRPAAACESCARWSARLEGEDEIERALGAYGRAPARAWQAGTARR